MNVSKRFSKKDFQNGTFKSIEKPTSSCPATESKNAKSMHQPPSLTISSNPSQPLNTPSAEVEFYPQNNHRTCWE